MISINAHEIGTSLSQLLILVEEKKEIIQLCRNGRPVAELKPIVKIPDPLKMHPKLKKVIIHEDPVLPLTNNEWPEEYR
jgi:antitoxin (DNA-binding transcriptional repressor) of toxin-antitoxin stability system